MEQDINKDFDEKAFKENIKSYLDKHEKMFYLEENDQFKISFEKDISSTDLLNFLDMLYTIENELSKQGDNNILLNLRGVKYDTILEAIKFSLKREDCCDAWMILNIINLIKLYNSLEEDFFEAETTYFDNVEEFVDAKLDLDEELQDFIKQLSIYFISLLKSYNKTFYTPSDKHIALANIYRIIFLSCDMATLCGLFAASKYFDTSECVYIDNALEYLGLLQQKSFASLNMLDTFFKGFENDIGS